jgi:glycosyltransferase involved in cell wall biosynthesis
MDGIKLTIITIVFNDVNNIEDTIKSVLKHKTQIIEYIIIDGSSKDGTLEIINQYKDAIDHIISEPDKGIYDAMNKGLFLAVGESIIFMNSGDVFNENLNLLKLINDYNLAEKILIGRSIQVYKGDSYLRTRDSKMDHLINYPAHQSIFVPKTLYKKYKYNTNLKIAADYFWIKEVMSESEYDVTYEVISTFGLGGRSSSNKFKDILTLYKEMKSSTPVVLSTIKFILFKILGQKLTFRIIYAKNYLRLK